MHDMNVKNGNILYFYFVDQMTIVIPDHKFLFPEYEIVIEPEELDSSIVDETEQDLDKNEELTLVNNTRKSLERISIL